MRIPHEELEAALRIDPWKKSRRWAAETRSKLSEFWNTRSRFLWPVSARLKAFQPKVRVYLSRPPFIIKTVESSWELESVLKLRSEVFYGELLGRRRRPAFDMDSYDDAYDHLTIIDTAKGRCVGTYRFMLSSHAQRFYSAEEFDISSILALPETKMELGRACIHRDYRNGFTIALLWKAIRQIMDQCQVRYLFGCSSVQSMDPLLAQQLISYFYRQGHVLQDFSVRVKTRYQGGPLAQFLVDRAMDLTAVSDEDNRRRVPPLLLSYLKAGAKVAPEPAFDRAFQCMDFLTLLDVQQLRSTLDRRSKQGVSS